MGLFAHRRKWLSEQEAPTCVVHFILTAVQQRAAQVHLTRLVE